MPRQRRSHKVLTPQRFGDRTPERRGRLVLAGPTVEIADPMCDDECRRIIGGCCDHKYRYDDHQHAVHDAHALTARQGERVAAYRCPFSSHRGGEHWHVGHPPTVEQVRRLALAMRWLLEHPDCAA